MKFFDNKVTLSSEDIKLTFSLFKFSNNSLYETYQVHSIFHSIFHSSMVPVLEEKLAPILKSFLLSPVYSLA